LKLNLGFNSFFIKKDSLTYQICDQEGDCDQAILYVTPHQDKSSTLIIPEAFSANNDGFNDTFRVPQFDYYEKLSLFVFNINGIPVFKSDDYENDWDGTANTGPLKGHLVPQGTYYYLLKIAGTTEELKGSIYITH
jgi:gliding motility-associated-like protein